VRPAARRAHRPKPGPGWAQRNRSRPSWAATAEFETLAPDHKRGSRSPAVPRRDPRPSRGDTPPTHTRARTVCAASTDFDQFNRKSGLTPQRNQRRCTSLANGSPVASVQAIPSWTGQKPCLFKGNKRGNGDQRPGHDTGRIQRRKPTVLLGDRF
jgi:hypothetical protein